MEKIEVLKIKLYCKNKSKSKVSIMQGGNYRMKCINKGKKVHIRQSIDLYFAQTC